MENETSRGYRKVADGDGDKAQAVNDALDDINDDVEALAAQIAAGGGNGSGAVCEITDFTTGTLVASQNVAGRIAARPFDLPANLTGSQIKADVAANAQTILQIKKNGVVVGSLTFAAGAQTPTVDFASARSFAVGDVFRVVGPAVPDAALANIAFNFLGTFA